MIDIGPRLDSRLRDKFDRIDAETPPERLMSFQPTAARRRHGSLNVIAGVAAIAVVAAGVAASALELRGHPHTTPTPSSSAQGGPLPSMPAYSPTPPPPQVYAPTPMPVYGTGFSRSWYIVIPVTKHIGSAVLPAFIPEGWEYIQYACSGAGHLQIVTADGTVNESFKPCSSSAHPVDAQIDGGYGPLIEGRPLALEVVTSPSVSWEIVVAETATPLILPTLPALPANAKVLVPLTYGEGIAALPSFTPHSIVSMDWWCSGPGGMQVFVSNGNESLGESVCGGLPGGGGPIDYAGKRETLVVDVSPHTTWEIRVYWQPSDSSG
ncbi:MAG TPA: hypothetical protein VFV02_09520 [Acidimicrobiales bacterium]|nr:hypothetical protein [Acidimicrobiales bacterium]